MVTWISRPSRFVLYLEDDFDGSYPGFHGRGMAAQGQGHRLRPGHGGADIDAGQV
jgi:hypothetical protein